MVTAFLLYQKAMDTTTIAGGAAFAEWRSPQQEAATKWLNAMAPKDPRCQPFLESAIRTLAYGAQAAGRFAVMDATERSLQNA